VSEDAETLTDRRAAEHLLDLPHGHRDADTGQVPHQDRAGEEVGEEAEPRRAHGDEEAGDEERQRRCQADAVVADHRQGRDRRGDQGGRRGVRADDQAASRAEDGVGHQGRQGGVEPDLRRQACHGRVADGQRHDQRRDGQAGNDIARQLGRAIAARVRRAWGPSGPSIARRAGEEPRSVLAPGMPGAQRRFTRSVAAVAPGAG
jgi:hypothetical protein